MDETGKTSFNALQKCGSLRTSIFFYMFDLMVLAGPDVMAERLQIRRALLVWPRGAARDMRDGIATRRC
jgi:ATP-dependent DNA ligase